MHKAYAANVWRCIVVQDLVTRALSHILLTLIPTTLVKAACHPKIALLFGSQHLNRVPNYVILRVVTYVCYAFRI